MKVTPAVLELLRAIDAGLVKKHFGIYPSRDYIDWDRGEDWRGPGRRYLTVTARVEKLWREDMVEMVPVERNPSFGWRPAQPFGLTNLGRSILDGGAP